MLGPGDYQMWPGAPAVGDQNPTQRIGPGQDQGQSRVVTREVSAFISHCYEDYCDY